MIRVAVIGCGKVARDVHLPLLLRRPDVRVAAVVDPDPDARAAAAKMTADAAALDDGAPLLAGGTVDAVIVASPPASHARVAVAALEAGCHVYVEKPMSVEPGDAGRIVHAWRQSGRVAMVGFNYRFNPLFREAARRIRDGAIGEVLSVRTVFTRPGAAVPDWQVSNEGGGALFDLASHHLDLVRAMTGLEVATVGASISGRGAGDTAALSGTLSNGASLRTLVSFSATSTDDDRVEVLGSRGTLRVDRYRSTCPIVRRAGRLGVVDEAVGIVRSATRVGYRLRKRRSPWHEPSYALALEAFVRGADGAPVSPTPDDGLVNVLALSAARESARTGAIVPVKGSTT